MPRRHYFFSVETGPLPSCKESLAYQALDAMGFNIMPFVAGAGVAGIDIGFAANDTLSNLIAGVLLIIDRPFEVGDRIEVWSAPKNAATWGDVIDIGLRATKIRTTDNIVIVISNNEMMKRDIYIKKEK